MNEGSNVPVASTEPAKSGNEGMLAIASLVCGAISLCGLFIPIIGFPFGILGLVLGYYGRKDPARKTYAVIGMALGGVGLILSCVTPTIIAVMRLLGPKIGDTFSTINSSLP
jgi:hypothetical protein